MVLRRDDTTTPDSINVFVSVTDNTGGPRGGLSIPVTATGGTAGVMQEGETGDYTTTVLPTRNSTAVHISVTTDVDGTILSAARTALVLPIMSGEWEQPEAVRGMVNTAGYEDGPEISPDGEWLIVSSYSYVDVFCCITGCGLPVETYSSFCQSVRGPAAAPERPDMPGAWRINSPTSIKNQCPAVCLSDNGGDITQFPLVPVSAFGFHRQPDGSFAEPFVIAFEADGCAGPFGFSFTQDSLIREGEVVFAYNNLNDDFDVWSTQLTLGSPNILSTYTCTGGVPVESNLRASRLPLGGTGIHRGNPNFRGGRLWFDDETGSPSTLQHVNVRGSIGDASYSVVMNTAAPAPTDDRRQPFFDVDRLFYARNLVVTESVLTGTDASLSASWQAATPILGSAGPSTQAGDIIAVGEPSIARRADNSVELYFVYATRLSGGGVDFNVGRVTRR